MPHPLAETLIVAERFCGPPHSGNGGYVAGLLAGQVHGRLDNHRVAVQVSLRQPPPLDAEMLVEHRDESARLTFGGALIAEATPVSTDLDPVAPASYAEAAAVRDTFPGLSAHPFPTCFGCGTSRPDGLQVWPGRVADEDGHTRVAATWTPAADLAEDFHEYQDPVRRARLAATWAAIDCVGGWAGDFGPQLMVLGRMTAVVDDLPVLGEPHVVMGLALGSQGRKTFTAATLYDADERIVARAEHLWITVDPETFAPQTFEDPR